MNSTRKAVLEAIKEKSYDGELFVWPDANTPRLAAVAQIAQAVNLDAVDVWYAVKRLRIDGYVNVAGQVSETPTPQGLGVAKLFREVSNAPRVPANRV